MLEAEVLEKEEAASHVIKNREASIEGRTRGKHLTASTSDELQWGSAVGVPERGHFLRCRFPPEATEATLKTGREGKLHQSAGLIQCEK